MVTLTDKQRARLVQLDSQLDRQWAGMCDAFQDEADRRDAECAAAEAVSEEVWHEVQSLHEDASAYSMRAYFAAHWALHAIDVEDPKGYRRYRALFLAEIGEWHSELSLAEHKKRLAAILDHFTEACFLARKLQREFKKYGIDDQLTVMHEENVALLTGHMRERGVIGDSNLRQLVPRSEESCPDCE